jgi:ML domain
LLPNKGFSASNAESFRVDLVDELNWPKNKENGCDYLTVGSCPLKAGETYEYTKNTKLPFPRYGNTMRFYVFSSESYIGCNDVNIVEDWKWDWEMM